MAKYITVTDEEHRLIQWLRSNLLLKKARNPMTENNPPTNPASGITNTYSGQGSSPEPNEQPAYGAPSPTPTAYDTPSASNVSRTGSDAERNVLYDKDGYIIKRSSDDPALVIITYQNQLVENDGVLLRGLVEKLFS
jgi:hypothetical protein